MAIDSGRVVMQEKKFDLYENEMQDINTMGNMIQGNMDSPFLRFYDSMGRLSKNILGYGHERSSKYHPDLGAVDISMTSMRDPGFYRMYKKIVRFFLKYKSNLPKYTRDQLVFPGIKIESVVLDELVTYFEYFESMISNDVAMHSHNEAQSLFIKARQQRLNHKPYSYHLTVNSDKATKGWVRFFLGPKYDVHGHEIDIVDNWMNFFEMDKWTVEGPRRRTNL
ncbi:larval serum protein 2-like [Belonocnema kinseyi]|uniref:larval serum protein 2-like n=1 Tax=Belonocnema kinseyi TaxID=2817044 RepID=UPI00143DC2A9|nr:larval serum protein 2-like [Belonocnema kinseyi]XP_033210307.1 larval serum protein 2-like [Belonocnema kinseyi]